MIKNYLKIFSIIFFSLFFVFLLGKQVLADESPGGMISNTQVSSVLVNPLNSSTFTDIFQKIISFFIKIGAPITAMMVLYGGYLILTAGDKSEQISKGKMAILYAAIGYIVVLSAWGVIAIIKQVLSGS